MTRTRAFDRDAALERATGVFWRHGFAGTSTEDLLGEMAIGRQSLYNTFGDKRSLYLESLRAYQEATVAAHIERLEGERAPLEGIRALLAGLALDDDVQRSLGCFGVTSVNEFGVDDADVRRIAEGADRRLRGRVLSRIREGQVVGEIDTEMDAEGATDFVLLTMTGLQVAARAGAGAESMSRSADFAIDRLRQR